MKRSILTNWRMKSTTEDFPLHLYWMPVRDWDNKYAENYSVLSDLRRLNGWQPMDFRGQVIASFEPIREWGEHAYSNVEVRPIRKEDAHERAVLEQVLMRNIEAAQPKRKYRIRNGQFTMAKPGFEHSGIRVHPTFCLRTEVDKTGSILIGFHLTHRFLHRKHLGELIRSGSSMVREGVTVVDRYRHTRYRFIRVDERLVGQPFQEIRRSLIDYYINRNQGFLVEKVSPESTAVMVAASNGEELPFIPDLLTLETSFEQLPQPAIRPISRHVKMSAHDKTERMIQSVEEILQAYPRLKYERNGLLAAVHGFELTTFSSPVLRFGQNHTSKSTFKGLKNGGVFKNETDKLDVTYLVDGEIIREILQGKPNEHQVVRFMNELENQSFWTGVDIHRINTTSQLRRVIFQDPTELRKSLKRISSDLHCLTVIITNEERADRCYEAIKQELTGKKAIATQVVTLNTVEINRKGKEYAFFNLLLGIYGKSGVIQPWVLAQSLHSDCFIGLDVSHDDGKHATGIVQVVGKDGRMLDSKPLRTIEKGEKIGEGTYLDLTLEAIHQYEETFGERPEHITFHRDGKCYEEELNHVRNIMGDEGVKFDYISVIKDSQTRIARFSENNRWETVLGAAYIKKDLAYLCSTNPHERMGMAKPLKIERMSGNLPMQQVVLDIFHLSYMHIGALNKTRLPVTTHYADKSSTRFNRGMLPSYGDGKALLFL
ncbi:Piwi domain-containing protein [Paludifilum halophilum]|uniref:Protein argonaute n=1 Tax=Paludifilum halophilum TaxID=1642702 RepID=A0A235B542_9BACL|nr:Piwi domain-containing protein [Paludifilum halophilum]OYD07430.1 hypothetical protein CHM34_11030 [Paludifilum halophilum]